MTALADHAPPLDRPRPTPPVGILESDPPASLPARDLDAIADDTHAALWLAESLAYSLADALDPSRLAALCWPVVEQARAEGWEAARREYQPAEPLDVSEPAPWPVVIDPELDRLRYPPHGRARFSEPRPGDFPGLGSPVNDSPPATACHGPGGDAINTD